MTSEGSMRAEQEERHQMPDIMPRPTGHKESKTVQDPGVVDHRVLGEAPSQIEVSAASEESPTCSL